MTTRLPGARLVFTQGLVASPFATAFRATRPAATITSGLLVLVQLVMAAITTAPWPIVSACPLVWTCPVRRSASPSRAKPRLAVGAVSDSAKVCLTAESATRSCGRLGPARLGTTLARSSASRVVNSGTGAAAVRNIPCSFM